MGRKRKNKQYFTKDTEEAIIEYNKCKDPVKRNRIYNDRIYYPFNKLAENILNTFKFSYFDISKEDIQHEVVAHLIEKMHNYKEGRGAAFSYFGMVAKNYLIIENNSNFKKYKRESLLSNSDGIWDLEDSFHEDVKKEEYEEFVNLMIEYWERNMNYIFTNKRDLQIADSIIEIFKRRKYIEHYKKKAIYIMIRDMTDYQTQHITKVVKEMKIKNKDLKDQYYRTGYIDMEVENSKFF